MRMSEDQKLAAAITDRFGMPRMNPTYDVEPSWSTVLAEFVEANPEPMPEVGKTYVLVPGIHNMDQPPAQDGVAVGPSPGCDRTWVFMVGGGEYLDADFGSVYAHEEYEQMLSEESA